MMLVSSLVEVGNVLALVHTRDLDWTVVMKETRVNYSVGESWLLIVLQSRMCDHNIIVNGQESSDLVQSTICDDYIATNEQDQYDP